MRSGAKLFIAFLAGLFVTLLLMPLFAPAVMVDVEIYEMEDGSYIYCASGTLTDPPAKHISSGSVKKGEESYC
jgi:hypothetical protein